MAVKSDLPGNKTEPVDPSKIPLSVILRSLTTPQWVTIISLCAGLLYGAWFLAGQMQSSKFSREISSLRDSVTKMKMDHDKQIKTLRDSVRQSSVSAGKTELKTYEVNWFAIQFSGAYSDKTAATAAIAKLRSSEYKSLQRIELFSRSMAGITTYYVVQLFDTEKERDQKLNYYEQDYPKDADNQYPKCGVPKSVLINSSYQRVAL